MTIERCDKAAGGFECIRLMVLAGACDCVTSEAFNKVLQAGENQFLKGDAGFIPCKGGLLGPFSACPENEQVKGIEWDIAFQQDEIGKVWDVLHAAGINSAGGMSASEGVKLLADNYQASRDRRNSITLMRGLLARVLDCGRLSFEADAPEELEALEVDICAALHQLRQPR